MKGFIAFEFDLPEALLASLVRVFDGMEGAPLLLTNVADIPEAQGVYQLLLRERIVYIGKTDAESGLKKRLERHARTVRHRKNLDPADVLFKAVRVFVFTAIDLETQLIRHYGTSAPVPWNSSGFGSNDPGRQRDTTTIKPNHFDALYPVDIDRVLEIDVPSPGKASAILWKLKNSVPYIIRFETVDPQGRVAHPELATTEITLTSPPYTTRLVVEAVVAALPSGWQATALAGRVILYRENRSYVSGTVIARS